MTLKRKLSNLKKKSLFLKGPFSTKPKQPMSIAKQPLRSRHIKFTRTQISPHLMAIRTFPSSQKVLIYEGVGDDEADRDRLAVSNRFYKLSAFC